MTSIWTIVKIVLSLTSLWSSNSKMIFLSICSTLWLSGCSFVFRKFIVAEIHLTLRNNLFNVVCLIHIFFDLTLSSLFSLEINDHFPHLDPMPSCVSFNSPRGELHMAFWHFFTLKISDCWWLSSQRPIHPRTKFKKFVKLEFGWWTKSIFIWWHWSLRLHVLPIIRF